MSDKFDYNRVKNPQYFQENRLPARSDHVWYGGREEMEAGESSFRHSLNGLWKFAYAPNYASSPEGFEAVDYDCRGWADIRVPAHIQLEGYDIPQYANVQYPWDGREQIAPGQIPQRFNPVADYVKYFTLPENMEDRPVFVSFQGVESAFALWCNGSFVGYSGDSFSPSEFELTPYLTKGENKLAASVFKWSAGSWCEDQDFFRFSGIFREVYLYTVPPVHVSDLKIQALVSESYDRGRVIVTLMSDGEGEASLCLSLREKGEDVLCGEQTAPLVKGPNRVTVFVENPRLWSAEEPNLYRLLVEVKDREGNVRELIPERLGFRRFEIVDSVMRLNGRRIVFKGVNRHEFSSVSGRVLREDELLQDLITMKRHNINAIRTCHYPNDSRLYPLCDELGFYLIDECNLESHGSWEPVQRGIADIESVVPGDRPEWHDMILDRANSMYQRDKNHPSILIWSCGNEAYGGKTIYDVSNFFREQDPYRIVQYEGIYNDRRFPDTSDVESQMYTPAEQIEEWLKENRSKPFICCEYAHAMGNSCGALHKYTALTETEPLYQGGFIWDYVDQSLYKKDRYGKYFQAYGGDFGERPTDYNFSGNGIVYGGDRTPSPKMQEVKYLYQNIGIRVEEDAVEIVNRNLFVNTDSYRCVVLLEREGRLLSETPWPVSVAPGRSVRLPLPVTLPDREGEYAVTVSFRLREDTPWARAGHEVAYGQGVFTRTDRLIADRPLREPRPLQVVMGNANLGVRGEEFEALFSFNFGGLTSYRYGGRELLASIPRPNFWRAPIDNDCGNDMMGRYGQWKLASMYLTHHGVQGQNPVVLKKEDCVLVIYTYLLPTKPQASCDLCYRVYGDGTIEVSLSYEPVPGLGDMPEFGVIFKMDADYDRLEWYGNGPQETYVDRQEGAKLGLYRNLVADNMARYLVPQECGNKTGVRYAKVTDLQGRGMIFAGRGMHFSALPYTPHEMENAMHPYELPQVHYTVVRAALSQMGVGGDNSWGARTHEEYLLRVNDRMEFTFCFKGI